ncbi:hypothetical protein HDU67_002428 [Dinochytrium kinnereticum]|nr:hypothetical protein HDU67_002428 [Dinochytrium kinnereticum]
MTDASKLPMYIHCLDGTTVTGVMIMLLRRLQVWSIPCAVAERARFLGGGGAVAAEEVEFVERFSGEFELANPLVIPRWLWGGQITFRRHPTMRVKIPPPPPPQPPSSGASSVSSVSAMSSSAMSGGGEASGVRMLERSVYEHAEFSSDRPIGRPSFNAVLAGRIAQSPQGSTVLVDAGAGTESSVRRRVVDVLQGRSSLVSADAAHSTGPVSVSDKDGRKLMRRQHGSNADGQISQTLDALALEI